MITEIFSHQEKIELLKLARTSITTYILSGQVVPATCQPASSIFKEHFGAFVTLTIDGDLRGCIGEIFPTRDLLTVIRDRAIDAAVNDPRFSPLTKAELDQIHIEISVLTPPKPVVSYNDIVIGEHGILLKKNRRSAVFLPQVATEQGWDLETTLNHLAHKAGLPIDGWKDGASFDVFCAHILSE